MRFRTVLFLPLCGILFSSCNTQPASGSAENAAQMVRSLDEQWSAAAAKHDLDAVVSFYADDAVVLPQNAPTVSGAKAIRSLWAYLVAPNVAISWKASKVEAAQSAD